MFSLLCDWAFNAVPHFRAEEAGNLYVVFLLHTPMVSSTDPEDLKVNSLSLSRDLTKKKTIEETIYYNTDVIQTLISGCGYSFFPAHLSEFELTHLTKYFKYSGVCSQLFSIRWPWKSRANTAHLWVLRIIYVVRFYG